MAVKIILHYASEADLPCVLDVERSMKEILGMSPRECDVDVERICASAHKTPYYLMEFCQTKCDVRGVILGRQPAASATIDANTSEPVVTYLVDGKDSPSKIYSSLDVPSGVGCMTAPPWSEAMALALLKIAGVKDSGLKVLIGKYQKKNREKIEATNNKYRCADLKDLL